MSLQSILRDRNVEAYRVTKKLLLTYSPVFDAIFDSLNTGFTVRWANIDFHPSNRSVVNVIGMLYYKIGEIMRNTANGEVIYIDDTNVDNYARPIRMILPVHQLEVMDVDGLILFVQEASAVIERSSHEELDILLADDVFITRTFTAFKTQSEKEHDPPAAIQMIETPLDSKTVSGQGNAAIVKKAPVHSHEGFDLDKLELDDIQLLNLKLLRIEGQA
jgi:hypothetical protein